MTAERRDNAVGLRSEQAAMEVSDRDLQLMARMASELAGQFSVDALLQRTLSHMFDLLRCRVGFSSLVDEEEGYYQKAVSIGTGVSPGDRFPIDVGVTGEVVRARRTVLLEDFERSRHPKAPGTISSLHAMVGVPIRWQDRILGVHFVFSLDPGRRFTERDLRLLEIVALQTAVSLATARAHRVAVERNSLRVADHEREQTLSQARQAVATGLAAVQTAEQEVPVTPSEEARRSELIGTVGKAILDALPQPTSAVICRDESTSPLTLADALNLECAWAEARLGSHVELKVSGEPYDAGREWSRHALNVMREAISNAVTHSGASTVRVGLRYEPHQVIALVQDNGRGFELQKVTAATLDSTLSGLTRMRSWAASLHGELDIDSTVDWGTHVRLLIPRTGWADNGTSWASAADQPGPLTPSPTLTMREQDVLELVGQGMQDKQIAVALGISVKTVEKHVGAILRKTGARNRTMVAAMRRTAS